MDVNKAVVGNLKVGLGASWKEYLLELKDNSENEVENPGKENSWRDKILSGD